MDVDTAVTSFLGVLASQYKVSVEKLQGCKIAKVVEDEVKVLLQRTMGEFSAKDFPWEKILTDDEELRPELLEPATPAA
jgi:hypothetical protein